MNVFDKLTAGAKRMLDLSFEEAKNLSHNYVGGEHFLLGILREEGSKAHEILVEEGASYEKVFEIVKTLPGKGMFVSHVDGYTPNARKCLDNALSYAVSEGIENVNIELILFAALEDEKSIACSVLRAMDIEPSAVRDKIAFVSFKNLAGFGKKDSRREKRKEDSKTEKQKVSSGNVGQNQMEEGSMLEKYGVDLTSLAEEGKLDPVIGREKEIERVIQILSRRTKNNPCIIGEPGVGKTAIVDGLASRIISGDIPTGLVGKRIVTVNMGELIAGTKFRGEFEERMTKLLEELKESKNVILFIDELHTIIGAGGAEGSMDASNILKPALSRGEIQVIGATTLNEYKKYIEKDSALERRFQSVTADEPSVDETYDILKGLRDRYEEHHKVVITDEALYACAKLAYRYINDRFLPDKAIDLMDEACAKYRLSVKGDRTHLNELEEDLKAARQEKEKHVSSMSFEDAAKARDLERDIIDKIEIEKRRVINSDTEEVIIDSEAIEIVVSSWTGIPVTSLKEDETKKLVDLENLISKRIIGQSGAIETVSRAIRRSRVGISDPGKPSGSYLLIGPTGVGKTEFCKAISDIIFGDEKSMIRFDMSEFMEKHSVSKLIGSPPGYVGYEEGGLLTEKIRRKPYSLVLFDEIEKAHEDIYNILLQILDEGALTDSKGRKVSFKNAIVMMTSNLGADRLARKVNIGFSGIDDEDNERNRRHEVIQEELKRYFKPEFLNRIDDVLIFEKLTDEDIKAITERLIGIMQERVKDIGIEMSYTQDVVDFLSKLGYDNEYGARPLKRVITKHIEDAIAELILDNSGDPLKKVHICVKDGKISIEAD